MKRKRVADSDDRRSTPKQYEIICAVCGNKELFVDVMAWETHLVNGRGDYIKLLDAATDYYLCYDCGARIEETTAFKK